MKQLPNFEGFEWDQGNKTKSIIKHGVSNQEAEQVFFNRPILVLVDSKHSREETRWHALGITDEERRLHITFTSRAGRLRVISSRPMSKKESMAYENNT
jgi:hypothetical protein